MDLQKVKVRLQAKYSSRQEYLERERLRLLHLLETGLTEFLSEFPTVSKVVVFGSLTRPGYFTELSDVDIGVAGLRNAQYWQACLWLEKCLGLEEIDLVRTEDACPRIMKCILRGKTIYEKHV